MGIKRFLEWIGLKERLHASVISIPYVREGEMWWASIGENVGWEINGKNKNFTRPVIVLKKLAKGFYFVIPVTSQLRNGTWYINFKQREKAMTACLQQARSMDYRRFYSKLGELDDEDYRKIKQGFLELYS